LGACRRRQGSAAREGRLTACLDGEAALRLGDARHDQVLKQTSRLDIGLELKVGLRIASSTNIAGGRDKLVQRDGLDHDGLRI
jgi:hypothetical protein